MNAQSFCAIAASLMLAACATEVPEIINPDLPPLPNAGDLAAFRVGSQPLGRFLLDKKNVGIGVDGVVRYVLVMRGSGGASSATFEGIRCKTGEYKLYASVGGNDWRPFSDKTWKPIPGRTSYGSLLSGYGGNDPRGVLAEDVLCDGSTTLRRDEIIFRLNGKHVDFLDPSHSVGE
ncbi:MAG: CNP1-like family protein [Azoarcus sp.]|jgi:hypothetical protein|nr:CNP1-like family protein [Azoarcus sp.]